MTGGRFRRVLSVVLLAAAAACGVPTDPSPRALPEDPSALGVLGRPGPDGPGGPGGAPAAQERVEVFLIRGCNRGPQREVPRLVPVNREVPAPPALPPVLESLFEGPTDEEVERGLCTALPDRSTLSSTALNGPVAEVDLSKAFSLRGEPLVLAIGQIVFTATALEGVHSVTFLLAGRTVQAPKGDGLFTDQPLRRDDFREFLEP